MVGKKLILVVVLLLLALDACRPLSPPNPLDEKGRELQPATEQSIDNPCNCPQQMAYKENDSHLQTLPSQVVTPTPTPKPNPTPLQQAYGFYGIPGPPPGVTPPPFDPPDTMRTPPIPRKEMPRPTTPEEFAAYNAQRQKEMESVGLAGWSSITKASGPETKGTIINIPGKNNKKIKLPDDVYIDALISNISCASGTICPQTPIWVIIKGNSRISVDGNGKIIRETIASGEEGAFDFLRRALQ